MKNTLKLTLVIALFCTTAFADGVMGTGTFAPTTTGSGGVMGTGGFADGNMGTGTLSGGGVMGTGTFTDGNMGGGGKTCTGNCAIDSRPNNDNSIMKFIQNYLFSIFG